jgi:hypothetical protein
VFDRTLVTSGFDTETLVSEEFLTYLLLAQVEAGLLPLRLDVQSSGSGLPVHLQIHPPPDYERRYPPHPDAPALPDAQTGSLTVELLEPDAVAFLHLQAWVTATDDASGTTIGPVPAGMYVDLTLEATEADGFEREHKIALALVALDGATRAALELAGINTDDVEDEIRAHLDRTIPLQVAQGQRVRRIRLRKFVTATQRSLGFYVDLALRSGPEPDAYVAARGDVDGAQDFRPSDAQLAFATSPDLFALLGPDAKARQAEPNASGTGFRYPLREDPLDRDSNEIGRIKGISVGPELIPIPPPTGPLMPTGRLMIDVHGEYTDALGDPDFHLQLFFAPKRDADGVVSWDLEVDVDLGLLATLFLVAVGIGLTVLFAPMLAWGSALIVGTLVGLAVLKGLIAEPLAAKLVEDHAEEDNQASVLDTLPFRLPVATRRWDPFYVTQHEIVGLLDEDVVIDQRGIAFSAPRLSLDKEPIPETHVVAREEERAGTVLSGMRYRVQDFLQRRADFGATAPGTDRMAFSRSDPTGEPTLVSLTLAQIDERIAAHRLSAPVTYTAERIHLLENQIDALLVLSRRERAEQRQLLISAFRGRMFDVIVAEFGGEWRVQIIDELSQQLGRPPTEDEVNRELSTRVNHVIDGLMTGFEAQLLPAQLEAAVAATLRLDLAPEELIQLQKAGAVILEGKEIIVRHNQDGSVTPYYRDHPDGDPSDNLLSLPHYTPPYQPPS